MAIQVILYQMSKDKNSTRRPSGPGNPYTVELKDACSVVDPVLVFNFGQQDYPSGFNYVQIPIFEDRCYWITNWQYFRGFWVASCHVDALASWRADIGASEQYILRAAAEYNGNVVDNLYPTLASQYLSTTTYNTPVFDVSSFNDGCFVLGVINDQQNTTGGGVTYYIMSNEDMAKLREMLLSSVDWLDIDSSEISNNLSKALINPYQYITSCVWYPYTPLSGGHGKLRLGWWSFDLYLNTLHAQGYTKIDTRTLRGIELHPQSAQRGGYLNLSPYTRRWLSAWPWGCFSLDTSIVAQSTQIDLDVWVDEITGQGLLYIYAVKDTSRVLMDIKQAQIGVNIPISQISINQLLQGNVVEEGLQAAAASLASFMSGGSTADVLDATVATQTTLSIKGTQGGIMTFCQPLKVISQFFDVADDDPEHRGRPLMARRIVSELPGFMMCDKPHIECHATSDEINQIEAVMSAGFYWE